MLHSQLKHLVADMFRPDIDQPDKIDDYEPLVGGAIGLDAVDTIEFAICVEESFGVAIQRGAESDGAFASIARLADFIHDHAAARPRSLESNRDRLRSESILRLTHFPAIQ